MCGRPRSWGSSGEDRQSREVPSTGQKKHKCAGTNTSVCSMRQQGAHQLLWKEVRENKDEHSRQRKCAKAQ